MADTAQVAPFTKSRITDTLKTSTQGAVNSCTGGGNGRTCGFSWGTGSDDGLEGAGQEMNVMSALSSLLFDGVAGPCTSQTCGTSQGDASAGSGASFFGELPPITTGDRAGAGILTALLLGFMLVISIWMSTEYSEGPSSSL